MTPTRVPAHKKFISLLLAALVIVQCSPFVLPARAANYTSAEGNGKVALGSTALGYTQVLTDNGDGTFSLALTLEDTSSLKDHNTDSNVSQNGYFTAPADGNYLIELWGGKGANGGEDGAASTGGAGGHVYGIVNLKKGETLFYQLGGDGQQTVSTETGGGVNGDGGNGGSMTTYTIGGGGGYSAIFKFAAGEFESTYLDSDGNLPSDMVISETDRTTKHIMIAAGGGGGGAEPGGFLGYGSDSGQANGGAGGSIGSATHVLDDGGTVFDGYDGETSGSSTQNVGEHGSYVPGGISNTFINRIAAILGLSLDALKSSLANDWYAATNPDAPGGNGGAGNLRGGSGGAGYCGGGGGIQDEIIVANNVGGGGGGSSYLAAEVDYLNVDNSMLHNGSHDSETGGSIHVTALAKDDGSTTTLESLSLTLTPTQYFDLEISAAEGISVSSESNVYTVSGIVLSEGAQTITLTFTPKEGFAGGNNVPLLQGNAISCTGTNQVVDSNGATSTTTDTCTIPLKANCSAVNVALEFDLSTKTYTTNDKTVSYVVYYVDENTPSDLYEGTGILNLNSWHYDFIDKVSNYEVTVDETYSDNKVTPKKTTSYPVSITVTPKSGVAAAVGTPVQTKKFTEKAIVTILQGGNTTLNGNSISYFKELTWDRDNSCYVLSLNTDISSTLTEYASNQIGVFTDPSQTATSYTAHVSGYYYIQAWGGDGGKGGDAKASNSSSAKTGGLGGYGAYLEGFVYLEQNETLDITVGAKGKSITDPTVNGDAPGGGGGGATIVSLLSTDENGDKTTTPLLIAGGGGGGGGARAHNYYITTYERSGIGNGESQTNLENYFGSMLLNGYHAEGCDTSNSIYNKNTTTSDFSAASGGAQGEGSGTASGYKSWSDQGYALAGTAGLSYIASLINDETQMTMSEAAKQTYGALSCSTTVNNTTINMSTADGAVVITPLQLKPSGSQADIADYTVTIPLSQYFVLKGNDLANIAVTNQCVKTDEDAHQLAISYTSIDKNGNNFITIRNIDPIVAVEEGPPQSGNNGITATETVRTASFVISINLVPRDGFLGGNDVPILSSQMTMTYAQDSETREINAEDATDYANVSINYALPQNCIEPGTEYDADNPNSDRTIDQALGESSIPVGNLYKWENGKPNFPTDPDDSNYWKYEYVKLVENVANADSGTLVTGGTIVPDPLVTTLYSVTIGVGPKVETAEKAIVIDSVPAVTDSMGIAVIVLPCIHYQLNNMKSSDELHLGEDYSDGYTTIELRKDHSATLSANTGYKLPDDITVTSNETTLKENSDYTYDASTGKFVLFAAKAVGTVTITATAVAKTYTVTYYYPEVDANGNLTGKTLISPNENESKHEYTVGASLENETPPVAASVLGYTFQWDWGNGATTPPATMPEKNLIVIGSYVPNVHKLTVNYVKQDGSLAYTAYVADVAYGQTYQVTSPAISGYLADNAVVSGTMGDEDLTITVTYTPTANTLNILYFYKGGLKNGQQLTQYTVKDTYATDALYSIDSPVIEGYTADQTTVSGTMTAEGVTVYVYYTPNTYTVTLDLNGGSASVTERVVEYDNIYNYDPTTGKYPGLPTPGRVGYEFDGWYLGETKVDGTTTVTTAANHTLEARWKTAKGTVTIVFVDENGNSLFFPGTDTNGDPYTYSYVTLTGDVGTTFSYDPPVKDKYEFTPPTVTGTFSATPQRITVTYSLIDKTYTLTIEYITVDEAVETVRETVITEAMSVGAQYTITHKTYAGYETTFNAWTYTMPEGGPSGPVRIYYYLAEQENVIHVTVNWGDLNFTYTQTNWDPQTHTYGSEITPITPNTNTVEVISGSETNIMLNVALSYEAVNDYNTLSGYFTKTENDYGTKVTNYTLSPNSAQKSYFWLNGTLTPDQVTAIQDGGGTATSGNCIVTITEG